MKRFLEWFLVLDRRIIYTLVALAVIVPLLFPLHLKIYPTPEVKSVYDSLNELPEGSPVLISVDFDPSALPELYPMLISALRQSFERHLKVFVVCLWPNGVNLAPMAIDEVITDLKKLNPGFNVVDGEDYVYLGYQPGTVLVMLKMAQDIRKAFPKDASGNETATLPIFQSAWKLSQMKYMVFIEAGDTGDLWIVYGTTPNKLPVGAGVTGVMAPQYFPWLQAKQVDGIIAGLKGAAEWEVLLGYEGSATKSMDPQSIVHALIFLAIVLANIFAFWLAAIKRKEERS